VQKSSTTLAVGALEIGEQVIANRVQ